MIVMVSGGFDPLHVGHVDLLLHARRYGQVWVALNSDAWLTRKKGYAFMPWEERAKILKSLRCVCEVVPVDDANGTVVPAILSFKPRFFANGGDRTEANPFEHRACMEVGCSEIFEIGGGKVQSSSELVRRSPSSSREPLSA